MKTILIHDGSKVLFLRVDAPDAVKVFSKNTIVTFPDKATAVAGIASLGLQYDATIDDRLTRLYNTLNATQKATYGVLFTPIKALVDTHQLTGAIIALSAVTVTPDLQALQTQMLNILKGST